MKQINLPCRRKSGKSYPLYDIVATLMEYDEGREGLSPLMSFSRNQETLRPENPTGGSDNYRPAIANSMTTYTSQDNRKPTSASAVGSMMWNARQQYLHKDY